MPKVVSILMSVLSLLVSLEVFLGWIHYSYDTHTNILDNDGLYLFVQVVVFVILLFITLVCVTETIVRYNMSYVRPPPAHKPRPVWG